MRMELKNHTHTVEKPVKSIFQLPNEKRNKKSYSKSDPQTSELCVTKRPLHQSYARERSSTYPKQAQMLNKINCILDQQQRMYDNKTHSVPKPYCQFTSAFSSSDCSRKSKITD